MRYFERIISGLLTLSALAIAGSVVQSTFFSPHSRGGQVVPPERTKYWEEVVSTGVRMGPANAPITIVEFMDFECPGCRDFHETVRAVASKHPDKISVVYLPYPLPMHRFALPAARAAECANAAGGFSAFAEAVFANQDSLGLKSWGTLAQDAGIRDTALIARCANSSDIYSRVSASRSLGQRVGVAGTPTVIVNGWRLFTTPDQEALEEIVKSQLLNTKFPGTK